MAYRSTPLQEGNDAQVRPISGWLTSIERDDAHSWQRLPHFIEPICDKRLSTGHLKFLDSQGAFDLPPRPLQRALVEAYAEFAYPYMPLIQLHEFLGSLDIADNGHSKRYSLLLYLGILFAGAAFVDPKALEGDECGFSTRKKARRELMKRATVCNPSWCVEKRNTNNGASFYTISELKKTGSSSHKRPCSCPPGQTYRTITRTHGTGWA